jgi:hypothetical protein
MAVDADDETSADESFVWMEGAARHLQHIGIT